MIDPDYMCEVLKAASPENIAQQSAGASHTATAAQHIKQAATWTHPTSATS